MEPRTARTGRILVAEDDPVSLGVLQAALPRWGYQVEVVRTGTEAWERLDRDDVPSLVLLDWMMPGMDGIEICRRVRQRHPSRCIHIILVTARAEKEDVVAGLSAGADDYLTKPVHLAELRARLHVGNRMVELQDRLSERIAELEAAAARIRTLQSLLPICMYCKKIRDVRNDSQYWCQMESYISEHAAVTFSHGVCPDCYDSRVRPEMEALRERVSRRSDRDPR